MAHNRKTFNAPAEGLCLLSKTTLADLVWELAATSATCLSGDDPVEVLRVVNDIVRDEPVTDNIPKREKVLLTELLDRFLKVNGSLTG